MKKQVEESLHGYFAKRQWAFQSVCSLSAAYMRDSPVTPYFSPRILRRNRTTYQVDGYFGIVHREFEKEWMKNREGPKQENRYCICRNIANFGILMNNSYISDESQESHVETFCNVVSDVLDNMPHGDLELREVFQSGRLCNVGIDGFVNRYAFDKYLALKEFVLKGR